MDYLQNVMGYFNQQQPLCAQHDKISKDLYQEYGVKAGLRDENGKGVLAGLTNISDIRAFEYVDGVKRPADGQLLYRGYDVKDLINGSRGGRFAFEEAGYLLLFGELPTPEKLEEFCRVLGECRTMPTNFTRDVIMKAPSHDIMNAMARSVLTLASYDPKAGDLDTSNVLRQSIQLASIFPMLAVYAYHAYNHYEKDGSMYIHRPDPQLSTAENFLRMLRPDMQYTPLEARVLDVALLLHAEHGGGNNSTFTTRVVTSSGTDTYSAMAAALCSLKGPRHGGANLMVMQMMQNIRENLHDQEDEEELETYLKKLLHGEAFDRKGLIYGMGHAVYSLSDPQLVRFALTAPACRHLAGLAASPLPLLPSHRFSLLRPPRPLLPASNCQKWGGEYPALALAKAYRTSGRTSSPPERGHLPASCPARPAPGQRLPLRPGRWRSFSAHRNKRPVCQSRSRHLRWNDLLPPGGRCFWAL